MVQIRTLPRRLRVRSRLDPRWVLAFAFGLLVSLTYYGLLIWGALWILRHGWALLMG